MDNSDVQLSFGLISGGVMLSADSPSHCQRTCEESFGSRPTQVYD